MILESIERAEEDFAPPGEEARVEATPFWRRWDKAKLNDAWFGLPSASARYGRAVNRLLQAYHPTIPCDPRRYSTKLNTVTTKLAELMNTAVRGALKGTKV